MELTADLLDERVNEIVWEMEKNIKAERREDVALAVIKITLTAKIITTLLIVFDVRGYETPLWGSSTLVVTSRHAETQLATTWFIHPSCFASLSVAVSPVLLNHEKQGVIVNAND